MRASSVLARTCGDDGGGGSGGGCVGVGVGEGLRTTTPYYWADKIDELLPLHDKVVVSQALARQVGASHAHAPTDAYPGKGAHV